MHLAKKTALVYSRRLCEAGGLRHFTAQPGHQSRPRRFRRQHHVNHYETGVH